ERRTRPDRRAAGPAGARAARLGEGADRRRDGGHGADHLRQRRHALPYGRQPRLHGGVLGRADGGRGAAWDLTGHGGGAARPHRHARGRAGAPRAARRRNRGAGADGAVLRHPDRLGCPARLGRVRIRGAVERPRQPAVVVHGYAARAFRRGGAAGAGAHGAAAARGRRL
ncbi:MAG: hypothetical protein AVDCRST_MAG08-1449, partial [uncultured Acetobacteraceae bacterium]